MKHDTPPPATAAGKRPAPNWSAERVLLGCLLGVGLLGLVMTYGSRVAIQRDAAALPDTLRHGSQEIGGASVRSVVPAPHAVHRFEAPDTIGFGIAQ